MRVFDDRLFVSYGQAYVLPSGSHGLDMRDAFRGQVNGLLGGAVPSCLFLVTALHTGYVSFTLDVLATAPELNKEWEEIVEASLMVGGRALALEQWGGEGSFQIPITPGSYRARYSARNMDLEAEEDSDSDSDSDPVGFYSLELWPAVVAPDAVLKQTAKVAQYWHNHAKSIK